MNIWITYLIIAAILVIAELIYFRIADKCDIIDRPNERSSHSTIVLSGGGIIFAISMIVWFLWQMVQGEQGVQDVQGVQKVQGVEEYLPFVLGLVLIAGVSFWDDIHSLPDNVRLVAQFVATGLMFWSVFGFQDSWFMVQDWYWQMAIIIVALIVCVGATNIINFMDGINGITAGYALSVLVPLALLDSSFKFQVPGVPGGQGFNSSIVQGVQEVQGFNSSMVQWFNSSIVQGGQGLQGFIEPSYLMVVIIGVLVFSWFNFRPKGKAKCFAGDVGSVGIAYILLFAIGRLIVKTGDVTWLIFLLVYGVDGVLTILHRIMLHENLGEAHRKHAYQIMANELKMGHVTVTLIYMGLQLAISLGFIYLCPNAVTAHWIYMIGAIVLLAIAYLLFMKKYYHLHEEYLAALRK